MNFVKFENELNIEMKPNDAVGRIYSFIEKITNLKQLYADLEFKTIKQKEDHEDELKFIKRRNSLVQRLQLILKKTLQ